MTKGITVFLLFLMILVAVGCKSSRDATVSNTDYSSSNLTDKDIVSLKTHFHNGLKQKVLGNFEQAAENFRKALKVDPDHHASMYELANIYEYQSRDAEALALMERAITLKSDNEWYSLFLADLYEKNGRYEQSSKIYENLAEKYPSKIEYLQNLANALIFQAKYKEAIEVMNRLEEKIGVVEEISVQKQKIYLQMDNVEGAIKEIQKLIKAYPKEPRYYGMLAQLYQSNDMTDKAMETFEKLKQLDPGNPNIHLSLADYYRNKGDQEKSFEELKQAFESPRLDIDTKVHILLSFYTITESTDDLKDEAFELLDILVEVHPNSAKSHSIYGDFLYRENRNREAKEEFKKALEIDNSKYAIWNQLLIIESELQDFQAMKEESEEAMSLFPVQPAPYLFNGIANIRTKDYEAAVESLEQGKDLVFGNPGLLSQFYANLGDVYHQLKQYSKSDSSYEKSLEIDPNNLYVLNNYSYYLSLREENLDRAAEMSKKTVNMQPGSPSYLDTYGWILYKQGKYDDAKIWIEKAISKGGSNSSVILEHYGDILFRLNDKEGALKHWEKAKESGEGSEFLDKKIEDQDLHE